MADKMHTFPENNRKRSPGGPKAGSHASRKRDSSQSEYPERRLRSSSRKRPRGRSGQTLKRMASFEKSGDASSSMKLNHPKISRNALSEQSCKGADARKCSNKSDLVAYSEEGNTNNNSAESLSRGFRRDNFFWSCGRLVFVKVHPFIETCLLTVAVLLLSSYLMVKPCSDETSDFIWRLSDMFILLVFSSYSTATFVFCAFVAIRAVTCAVAKISSEDCTSALGTVIIVCLIYHWFPNLPNWIVDCTPQLVVICAFTVFLLLFIQNVLNITSGPHAWETERFLSFVNILLIDFGVVGSMILALTFGWVSWISHNFTITMSTTLAACETLHFVVFLILKRCVGPEVNSILVPKRSSPPHVIFFESLIWLPFGLNTGIRYCYMCEAGFSSTYLLWFLCFQIVANIVFVVLGLRDTTDAEKRTNMPRLASICELVIVVSWFSAMGVSTDSVLHLLTLFYVVVARSDFFPASSPKVTSRYGVNSAGVTDTVF